MKATTRRLKFTIDQIKNVFINLKNNNNINKKIQNNHKKMYNYNCKNNNITITITA